MSDSKISVPTLSETLAKFPCLKLQTNNKILCSVTGHEMSARADVVYSYITGKKFKKDSEWYLYDFSEFLPYIVPDKVDAKKYMRCKITDQRLNRIPQEIKNHMSGKKFQRLVKEHEELEVIKKRKLQEKADKESLWVPPEDADNEDENEAPAKKSRKAAEEGDDEDDDEDNMSDLLGSDIESDGESDGDEEEDEEEEVEVVKKVKPSKATQSEVVVAAKTNNITKSSQPNKAIKSNIANAKAVSKGSVDKKEAKKTKTLETGDKKARKN